MTSENSNEPEEAAGPGIQVEQGEPAGPRRGSVSLEDAIGLSMGDERFNLAREMLEGSSIPEKFLARTRSTDKEIARVLRILANQMRWKDGRSNIMALIVWQANAKIGQNGMARQEAVTMALGMAANRRLERADALGFGGRGMGSGKEPLR